ncbi:Ankyrin repeat domain-containing protein 11 [Blyttiomyces sp. JEL0837]|nr:Ankyrin repeat domain-containing protein 11 [Blyttiomyces sp. JEL0837]
MGRHDRVVFAIGRERHLVEEAPPDSNNNPKKIRKLIRELEKETNERNYVQSTKLALDLIQVFIDMGDYEKVLQYCKYNTQHSQYLKGEKQARCMAWTYVHMGRAYHQLEQHELALVALQKVSTFTSQLIDEEEGQSIAYEAQFTLGCVYLSRGEVTDADLAEKSFTSAEKIFLNLHKVLRAAREVSNLQERCDVLMNLGILNTYMGKHEIAVQNLEKALKLARELAFIEWATLISPLRYLSCYYAIEDLMPFDQYLMKEASECCKANDVGRLLLSQWALVERYMQASRYSDAQKACRKYIDSAREVGEKENIQRADSVLVEIEQALRTEHAVRELTNKIALTRRSQPGSLMECSQLLDRAQKYVVIKRYRNALEDFNAIIKLPASSKMPQPDTFAVYDGMGDCLVHLRSYDDAVAKYRQGLQSCPEWNLTRAKLLSKLGSACLNTKAACNQIISLYNESYKIGETLGDTEIMMDALASQKKVFLKFSFNEKARQVAERLAKLEESLRLSSIPESEEDEDDKRPAVIVEETLSSSENAAPSSEKDDISLDLDRPINELMSNDSISDDDNKDQSGRKKRGCDSKRSKALQELLKRKGKNSEIPGSMEAANSPRVKVHKRKTSSSTVIDLDTDVETPKVSKVAPIQKSDSVNMKVTVADSDGQDDFPFRSPVRENLTPAQGSRKKRQQLSACQKEARNGESFNVDPIAKNSNVVVMSSPQVNQFKVRVNIEDEVFAIPCNTGPTGTPKTVGWLQSEAVRRFKSLHGRTPRVKKLVACDPDSPTQRETLGGGDLIKDVLVNKQLVLAVPPETAPTQNRMK